MLKLKKILVSSDLSEESTAAFPIAKQFAEMTGAKILLVTVNDEASRLRMGYLGSPGLVATLDLDAVAADLRTRAERRLAELGEKHGLSGAERIVLEGVSPSRDIVRLAKERGVDLIVVATHGRGGVAHVLLGSTAERVVREAPCPVLTVRCAS
jgi:nucleotide-binding universal stress UspA family protein